MKAPCSFPQVERYFQTLRVRGVKEITIERYRSQIVSLFKALTDLGIEPDFTTLTEEDVHTALATMNLAESSTVRYASTIKGLAQFYGNRRLAMIQILSNGNRPNVRWITDAQFLEMMKEPDITDRLLIHLGGTYGLRRGEMAALKLEDIRDGYMVVHGKGHGEGKIRHVPLMGLTDPVIEEYRMHRDRLLAGAEEDLSEGHLVVYRAHYVLRGIRAEGIGRRITAVMERHGIDASSHSLRREFITASLNAGCSVTDVMQVVGHTSPAITARYIRYDVDHLRGTIRVRNEYISNQQSEIEEHEARAW